MSDDETREALNRREALRRAIWGAAGLALLDHGYVRAQTVGNVGAKPGPKGRAKAVIQIWMWGGPPHTDTFDPKPEAGYDYCGPLTKTIATNVSGIQFCDQIPLLAKQADKCAILRGVTHGNNGHETAAYIVQTGRQPGERLVYPSVGAVVSLYKGYDAGYKGLIPPYIVMTAPQGRFSESGFLGQRYKPFATGGDPNRQRFEVEGVIAAGITDERQKNRRELLHSLDTLGLAMADNPRFQQLDACEEKAYDLILGDAGKLFDLSQEPAELRDKYGRSKFGQSCLMARRLVEAGVPYVTINYGGWDTHKQHFEAMRRLLPELDRGFSTLLQDLGEKGLLESTIVWQGGEFGRTPKVDWSAPWNGGRHHFGKCFSTVLAGGGFKGGQVIGSSNKTGEEPAERPVSPQEIIRTIYYQLGIDPDGKMPNPRGLDVTVSAPSSTGGLLKELI